MFNDSVCDLALQSRDFDVLLGTLNVDGSRTPGAVDKFKVSIFISYFTIMLKSKKSK